MQACQLREYYYTRDHLGSVRELLNSSGTILTRYSYDAYGNTTTSYLSGSTDATFQYAGMQVHLPSGKYLTWRRIYDALIGRWFSRDPMRGAERSQGPNLYEYVANNPIDDTDPSGLCTVTLEKRNVNALLKPFPEV